MNLWYSVIFSFFTLFTVLPAWCPSAGHAASSTVILVPKQFPTITQAVASSKSGDTIQVAQGTYQENIALKPGVILKGGYNADFSGRDISGHETVIDGQNNKGPVVLMAEGATLDGFTIVNGSRKVHSDNSTSGSGVYNKNLTGVTISNNTIRNNEPAGIYCNNAKGTLTGNRIAGSSEAGIFVEKGSDLIITGNIVSNNNFAGISAGDKPANKPDSRMDVRSNTIHGNGKAGIDAASATGTFYNNIIYKNAEAGMRIFIGPVEIVNNTIVANARSGVIIIDPKLVPVIKNNIIAHHGEAGIRSHSGGYSHNLLFSNFLGKDCNPEYLWCVRNQFGGFEDEESYKKNKNIIADPLFVNMEQDNFRLKGGSPAIDGGDPDKQWNDVHFAPSLGAPVNDMGAYGGPYAVPEQRTGNTPPVPSFETDEEIYLGQRVKLDARESMDPDGDLIGYQWTLRSAPEGSKARFKNTDKVKASLKTDKAGDYEIELTVTDRLGLSGPPLVKTISVLANRPPKAAIGEVFSRVKIGETVTLYGSGSEDKDKDPLSYDWKIVYKPDNSKAVLRSANAENTSFQIDAVGSYGIQLTVNDGQVDSQPTVTYVSTGHKAENGIRHVPAEYPTIQLAVDAADNGDTILVQKGVYTENIILDKNVSLKGIDWPIVTGKNRKGNTNTIQFAYLGDMAGKIEGFVVTGGGKGGLGHGLNVWDSSPEIFNNIIHGNKHNGIGIHGRGALTSKTRIHNNLIHDNGLGIGNGLGSGAHIYNNRIFNNAVVGIGCRGLSLPRIEGNYIYNNRMGIGTREVSSPLIVGNHIYNNVNGIVIGPSSTIKKFAGPDIIIKNNLVYGNHRVGIAATSFNMSKIIVINNTIDSNNTLNITQRAGGLVFGWPGAGEFTAVVENNLITNNHYAGIANNIGLSQFPTPGVVIHNVNNLVWKNDVEYEGLKPGSGEISQDPMYGSAESYDSGNYFLTPGSPAVDAGNKTAADLGLEQRSTRQDMSPDVGQADLGYHYKEPSERFIEK